LNTSTHNTVEEVKSAVDIVEIVGNYITLKPSGGQRFKACCPFHQEKTPSFIVSRDRQSYHCFGCSKGGDVISFVQEIEGLTFPEVLQQLADKAGIQLPAYKGQGDQSGSDRQTFLDMTRTAARYYVKTLRDSERGQAGNNYLATRNLQDETIRSFGLGYIPDGWNQLVDVLRQEGYQEPLIAQSGLAKRKENGGLYDTFRNRVMFPIRDTSGRVVAFGGRDLGDSPAKYMNSPENTIYKKSRVLYGLYEARDALRTTKQAILVEGYFDLLRCVDAGIPNVVATCGTALTADQALLLKRYVPEVLLVFDGDQAGIQAALRGIGVLASSGLIVKALDIPDGMDPDDYILAEGADTFRRRAEEAEDFVTFYVRMNGDRSGSIEGRTDIAHEMFDIFKQIDDISRQDEYVRHLAEQLKLDPYKLLDEFRRVGKQQKFAQPDRSQTEVTHYVVNVHECDFIAVLINEPNELTYAREKLGNVRLPASPLWEVIEALFQEGTRDVLGRLESQGSRTLYAAASVSDNRWGENGHQLVDEFIQGHIRSTLEHQRSQFEEEMETAERSNESQKALLAAQKIIDLQKQIEDLKQL
jgi:DNA primase